jgi:hypothetical protein
LAQKRQSTHSINSLSQTHRRPWWVSCHSELVEPRRRLALKGVPYSLIRKGKRKEKERKGKGKEKKRKEKKRKGGKGRK